MGNVRAGASCNAVFVILVLSCRVHAASLEYKNRQKTLTVVRLPDICANFVSFDMVFRDAISMENVRWDDLRIPNACG